MKKIVIIGILEGRESNTEKNFFEPLMIKLQDIFKQNIIFIPPFSINGNSKDKKKFIINMDQKIIKNIELKTGEKINNNQKTHIFCIWDSQKGKNNFQTNFDGIKKQRLRNHFYELVFDKGIEMGLFSYIFSERITNINKLVKKLDYASKNAFKKRGNQNLFWLIIKKSGLDANSDNFIKDLIDRLKANKEKILCNMIDIIQKLND